MRPTIYADCETYSDVPINHGTSRYAERAEVLLLAYAVDNGPVEVIDLTVPGTKLPRVFFEASKYVFHNSYFDRTVLARAKGCFLPTWMIEDTMVMALAHGLPGKLETLCDVMTVDADKVKDKRGKELIQLFCKPRPKNHKLRRATRETHPAEWQAFIEYARYDVIAMRELHRKLPRWNIECSAVAPNGSLPLKLAHREHALWQLDQAINDRGIQIDMDLARAAVRATDAEKLRLAGQTQEITDGALNATTQRDELLKWILEEHGVDLPDMQAATLERRIEDDSLPSAVRELLLNRLQATTTSVAKYKRLLDCTSEDGRLRGTMQFCGAQRTARWAGRIFQPQNMPRPTIKNWLIDLGIEAMKGEWEELICE
jgi:DNA polymerase bacteriophage-type